MTEDREKACAAILVPESLQADVAGYRWARNQIGESGAIVYRLHGKPGAPGLFLKRGVGKVADDITNEMVRLRWLAGRLPVPTVRRFVGAPDEAWLLMEAVPGATANQLLEADPASRLVIVDALVDFLHRFHAIPATSCPFTSDHPFRLAQARQRIDAQLVDEEDFDEARQGWSAEEVWTAMQKLLPFNPDPVVTHGDFSLDNLLMQDGVVVGCIDVGRVGIADRYQDLAILWSCLGEFDSALQDRLFERYGLGQVDRRKLDFHLMLDEMF